MGKMSYRRMLKKGLIPPEKQVPQTPEQKELEEKNVEVQNLAREVYLLLQDKDTTFEERQMENMERQRYEHLTRILGEKFEKVFMDMKLEESNIKLSALKTIINGIKESRKK